jgi:hypothetical protein
VANVPLRVWQSSTENASPCYGTNPLPVLTFSVPASVALPPTLSWPNFVPGAVPVMTAESERLEPGRTGAP